MKEEEKNNTNENVEKNHCHPQSTYRFFIFYVNTGREEREREPSDVLSPIFCQGR